MSLYFGYFSHFRHQSNLTPPSLISNPSAFIDFKLSVPWSPLPGRFPFQMYSQRESKNRLQTRRIYVQPYDMVSDPSPTTSQLSNYLQVLQYVTTLQNFEVKLVSLLWSDSYNPIQNPYSWYGISFLIQDLISPLVLFEQDFSYYCSDCYRSPR